MKSTGYDWWIKRLKMSLKIYDVVRIDHFRGFEAYYCIKYGETTARNGKWRKGPDIAFGSVLKADGRFTDYRRRFRLLTPRVHKMLEESGFPV